MSLKKVNISQNNFIESPSGKYSAFWNRLKKNPQKFYSQHPKMTTWNMFNLNTWSIWILWFYFYFFKADANFDIWSNKIPMFTLYSLYFYNILTLREKKCFKKKIRVVPHLKNSRCRGMLCVKFWGAKSNIFCMYSNVLKWRCECFHSFTYRY